MAKRTQSDYVKMFQDSLNGFVQDLHPLGGMATGVITVVEMIDSEGKYFLHVIEGMLDAAHIQLDEKEFDEDDD